MRSDLLVVRDAEEERWITVSRNGKRVGQKVDVYINCFEKLPKQFALAKLLKTNNIKHISRVKYVNAYKVFVQFECAESADELMNCTPLKELGWRFQKPLEVAFSYGVIKDIELEMTEKEILEVISSDCELIGVKRLKRRKTDGKGWEDSESIRLQFKGSSLPASVYIYGMKINVDPYVFPVTQCSRCWRFGHSLRVCPSKKIVCPKCGKGHANCEITTFRCINCIGSHMSLDRSCPIFIKEKRLRSLMAEFNCSYKKALQIYIPPEPQPVQVEQETTILKTTQRNLNPNTPLYNNIPEPIPVSISQNEDGVMSYANVTRSVPRLRSEITSNTKSIPLSSQSGAMEVSQTLQEKTISTKRKRKKKQNQNEVFENDISTESEEVINNNDDDIESELQSRKEKKERREKLKSTFNFRQLLSKLYAIFTNSQEQLKNKMIQGMSLIIEWLVPMVGQCIWDLPFKSFFSQ
ncbi:unnamed protein product [Parnassius apollo]|uniref:(apollo) hypothetical protein n=1 Tax=Parnassius apollo TaxID=110799 RepID=A0A8S3X9Y6_PARAO|nr:unnamed protein product [Parnassius apollo]